MPRKAAVTEGAAEPRRSTRIKDQPKPEPVVKKAPAKPRAKKADKVEKEGEEKEEKPKAARGRKRKNADEANGAEAEGDADAVKPPPSKKVPSTFHHFLNPS